MGHGREALEGIRAPRAPVRVVPRAGLALALALAAAGAVPAAPASAAPLTLVRRIPLPGVEGRLDHLAVDPAGGRLFVAALGNGTIEVVSLRTGARERSLAGFREPQGVGFLPHPARLYVANGGDGTCVVLGGGAFRRISTRRLGEDADDLRLAPSGGAAWVGFGDGGLARIGVAAGDTLDRIALDGHPEGFQLEAGGPRIFVNVPGAREVEVVDRTRGTVVARWKLGRWHANFPMALDEAGGRVFVGCRLPSVMLVLDTATGHVEGEIPIGRDVDDLFYDPTSRMLYASCGAGFVDVLRLGAGAHFERLARVRTGRGARTALYVASLHRLYVAVPHRGTQSPEVLEFAVRPD